MFEKIARVSLAQLPTPLEELKRLSDHMKGPRIFMKRDDYTGLALGGNKARKLEFLVQEALDSGADTLVTTGGIQSNHCRMTVSAARRFGMDAVLLLSGEEPQEKTGNLLLNHIMGATIHYTKGEDFAALNEELKGLVQMLKEKGKRPYLIPVGGSNAVGAMGYVMAAEELDSQLWEIGSKAKRIYLASGSGGTQAGLTLGNLFLGKGRQAVGISVSGSREEMTQIVAKLMERMAERIGMSLTEAESHVVVDDGYIGEGYGIPTQAGMEAIKLVAELEGIILDPVYTGKAMAGMLDHIKKGRIPAGEDVVFLHTGGAPGLFAYGRLF